MRIIKNQEMLFAQNRVNLEISALSYAELDDSWYICNMRSAFTRIYIPLSGEGFIVTGDRKTVIHPGNIYIIPSGLTFTGFCKDRLDKLFVHIVLSKPDGTDIFGGIDHCIVLQNQNETINRAWRLYNENSIMSVIEFKLMLYELAEAALSEAALPPQKVGNYSQTVKNALCYIDEHISAALTIDGIANALFIPKSTLQRKFKSELGKSVGEYIDGCLNLRAEADLLDSSLSIKEISDRLGYCDQFYFSRKFKKTHGISPRAFRKKHNI